MDLAPLRQLALELNFDAHGFDVTVHPVDEIPVDTRAIWMVPETAGLPTASEFQRTNARRMMALRSDVVTTIQRKTTITIPAVDPTQELDEVWIVDAVDTIDNDHHRVTVTRKPD